MVPSSDVAIFATSVYDIRMKKKIKRLFNRFRKKADEEPWLVEDHRQSLPKRDGNGLLVRRIWVNPEDKNEVIKYSLVYINDNITTKDNGRVLGYDNNHGRHHKHKMGKESLIDFSTFDELEAQFQTEFEEIHNDYTQNR